MLCTLAEAPSECRFGENRLLAGIAADALAKLTARIEVIEYQPDDLVFNEADPGDALYLVGTGSVKISKAGRGGQQETLGYIQPGNFFGEMALIDGQPRSAQATAAERTILGRLDENAFHEILAFAPSRVQMNFLRTVVERLRGVNSHFISEMMRTERLSLVGTMANSIIHDLKNPIGVIRCCSDLLASKIDHPDCRQFTTIIDKALEGMMGMTQELLDFARGNTSVELEPLPVRRLVREFEQQALRLLPSHIRLVTQMQCDGIVEVDQRRFLRALANLVKNAMEAMPGGGVLSFLVTEEANEVVFTIADTGCGIAPEIQAKIFEPFVTLGKANGTGLGMAIVKSVIDAHKGRIWIESTVGVGTKIHMRLALVAL
ncbi:MAG TPA: ATP-binding protein [Chthoniobacteraceae bacterium]|jgi:signal transduction histidine kinase